MKQFKNLESIFERLKTAETNPKVEGKILYNSLLKEVARLNNYGFNLPVKYRQRVIYYNKLYGK